MIKCWTFPLLLSILVCSVTALGQVPLGPQPKRALTPDDYQPRNLKQIATEETEAAASSKSSEKVYVHGDLRPSKVRARYAGRSRLLPRSKQAVLNRWAQLYAGAPQHYTVPYKSEILFTEAGVNYWLAVRRESVAQFSKTFKKGGALDLFVVRLGGTYRDGKWESLILVESFQKAQAE